MKDLFAFWLSLNSSGKVHNEIRGGRSVNKITVYGILSELLHLVNYYHYDLDVFLILLSSHFKVGRWHYPIIESSNKGSTLEEVYFSWSVYFKLWESRLNSYFNDLPLYILDIEVDDELYQRFVIHQESRDETNIRVNSYKENSESCVHMKSNLTCGVWIVFDNGLRTTGYLI